MSSPLPKGKNHSGSADTQEPCSVVCKRSRDIDLHAKRPAFKPNADTKWHTEKLADLTDQDRNAHLNAERLHGQVHNSRGCTVSLFVRGTQYITKIFNEW